MPKEKNYNPVQAQRKADKARAIKKGKADQQTKRNERLAKKNPARLSSQIEQLKAVASSGGTLTRHEQQVLEGLEKELKAVTRAREALGESAPVFRSRRDGDESGGGGVLGKRRRGGGEESEDEDGEEVPDDVKSIPMPRDTPPPIPREVLDRWYQRRRERRQRHRGEEGAQGGRSERKDEKEEEEPAAAAAVESKTVYEAKPVVRDLRKEAVAAFVPSAVRSKIQKGKGEGGLLEEEELERLEREGYVRTGAGGGGESRRAMVEDAEED